MRWEAGLGPGRTCPAGHAVPMEVYCGGSEASPLSPLACAKFWDLGALDFPAPKIGGCLGAEEEIDDHGE
jgi:hypothetical protein